MKKASFTLLLILLLSMVGIEARADGSCGDGVTWAFSDGTLTISKTGSGSGKMTDSYYEKEAPWYSYNLVIRTIVINEGVTSIAGNAFIYCSAVTSVTIGNSVVSIGGGAFFGCSSLTSITIPNSVASIGGEAFSGCSKITSITIPNSVTSIGNGAFSGCSGLTSMTVESGNTKYDSRGNCNAIIETSTNTLIAGCQNTAIHNGVTGIASFAFYGCSGLTAVTIPNSVTSIGSFAFSRCSGLTSITIPCGVTVIDYSVFSGCSGLTSITIPNSVTSIGDNAFAGCSGLTSVTIGNSVTSIGYGAFRSCSGLTSITIPNSVTSIGNNAFEGADIPTVISLIENPFTITEKTSFYRTFSQNTFNNATLYVPKGTIDKYKATEGWKDFAYIVEGDPTGIKNIETEQLEEVSYYGLDGKRTESPKSGSVVIKKAGQKAMKVVVK